MFQATSQSQARPGRPKDPAKTAAVRHAAGRLFLERGFERTSMDSVATEAGVSKNTVYSHFESKEALFGAVVAHEVGKASAAFARPVPVDYPLTGALRKLGQTYQELLFEDRALRIFRVVIGESAAHPEVARILAESASAMTQAVFERFIAKRVASGELATEDVPAAASLLLTLIRGEHHMRALMNFRRPTAIELERQLDVAIRLFLACYSTRDANEDD